VSDKIDEVIKSLPDVYFDWYARLLPGCFGVGLYLYLSSNIPAPPTGVHVVLFLLFGYGLGHVLQPLAGFPIKRLETLYFDNEAPYVKARNADSANPSVILVNKAHAEANSMAAFSFALLLNLFWFWDSPILNKSVAFVVLSYFALAAVERTWARDRKIKELS
jgi:hypothetical protein